MILVVNDFEFSDSDREWYERKTEEVASNDFAKGGQTKKSNAGLVGVLAVAIGVLIGRQIKL